jgi:hypothetical protein
MEYAIGFVAGMVFLVLLLSMWCAIRRPRIPEEMCDISCLSAFQPGAYCPYSPVKTTEKDKEVLCVLQVVSSRGMKVSRYIVSEVGLLEDLRK